MTITNRLRCELVTWAHYFIIMFIAATAAGVIQDSIHANKERVDSPHVESIQSTDGQGGDLDGSPPQINVHEMFKDLWEEYYRGWILVFIGLSGLRLLIILSWEQFRKRMT